MSREGEFAIKRYEAFLREVLTPAIYPSAWPVRVSAWQYPDFASAPPAFSHAVSQSFQPVELGWEWGPKWSTCWFHVAGIAPTSSHPLHLRFATATESLVYLRNPDGTGQLLQGLDTNRDALINHPVVSGQPFEFFIESACNHPFGVYGFEWDHSELLARWNSPRPGRLTRCEIAAHCTVAASLALRYTFTLNLLKELQSEPNHFSRFNAALRQATNFISDLDIPGSAPAAIQVLDQALSAGAGANASKCLAVGHAHIDTAWLWPIRETRRKCLRTFSNVIGLLNRNPDFHFICSQAQQYEFVRQDAPALFSQIKAAVEAGQWEPLGATWVEPDANCPSGESFIRQCLHGTRYWTSHFGPQTTQRLLFLPDTFGFPATLPGLMNHCGLDTFITNKLHWNTSTEFPHATFDWRGIDGSVVLAHNTPGKNYNASLTPKDLRRGNQTFSRLHETQTSTVPTAVPTIWFQPFGFGDGGGGPTQCMIDAARLASNTPGLPHTSLGSARAFINNLHTQRDDIVASGKSLPTHRGELYLELHRGTLTTHAWIKRANRLAEIALQSAEFAAFFSPVRLTPDRSNAILAALDRAWRLLLLNQFHDILPGSSIAWVYDDARRDFAEIQHITQSILDECLPRWAAHFSPNHASSLVLNPTDTTRSGLTPDRSSAIVSPPFSVSTLQPPRLPTRLPCSGDQSRISNGLFTIHLDSGGRITALSPDSHSFPDAGAREVLLNQLVMYEDHPHAWDAWEIDSTYLEKPEFLNHSPCHCDIVESTPQRIAVSVSRHIGKASHITQIISLESGSPYIHIHSDIDWHEDHRLLRVLQNLDSTASSALCGVPCGSLSRPLVPSTPAEKAKFEFCAHGFVAIADRFGGIAVLCPDKFGWSARRECSLAQIGTSLLRAPKFPDPTADRGRHQCDYAILPLLAPPDPAALTEHAERFGSSPIFFPASANPHPASLETPWSPFEIEASCGAQVRVIATKRAQDNPDALIVRVHESAGHGGILQIKWNLPVKSITLVNGIESPIDLPNARLKWDPKSRTLMSRIWPFGILAFQITLEPA